MNFKFRLSKDNCLSLVTNDALNTKYSKHFVLYIRLVFLVCLISCPLISMNRDMAIINLILLIPLMVFSRYFYNVYFKRQQELKVKNNAFKFFLGHIELNLTEKGLTIQNEYEVITTSSTNITGLSNCNAYIIIYTNLTRDILIPSTSFESIESKDNFINNLGTDLHIKVSKGLPKKFYM